MIDIQERNYNSQPSLFEEGRLLAIPQKGMFAIGQKPALAGKMTFQLHALENLEFHLKHLDLRKNIYLSQCIFKNAKRPRRRQIDVSWTTHAYVDLDTYTKENYAHLKPDQVVFRVVQHCTNEGIPCPSYIICSGRGYYLKWAWSKPLSSKYNGLMLRANKALIECFSTFGADTSCGDLSRVLRLTGTMNYRKESTTKAELVWVSVCNGTIKTYDFREFMEDLNAQHSKDLKGKVTPERIKRLDQQLRRDEQASNNAGHFTSYENYNWLRFEDLRTLSAMRHGDETPETQRHLFAFPMACSLVASTPKPQTWYELKCHLNDP